jgi:phytoene synthase
LHARLDGVYAARPLGLEADRALARVVRDFAVPRGLLDALLEGFEWDLQQRRYDDLDGLHAYAARVAGTVGAMMALLMGTRDAHALARACDLGVAMQLSNIARDVGEDARAGRLYLPTGWLREAGIEPEAWLRAPVFSPALGAVVGRLLQAADQLYRRADAGIAVLPARCRPGIRAARHLYAEIGRQVERQGLDSVSRRAVVPGVRKLHLLGCSLAGIGTAALQVGQLQTAPLAQTRFLVEAVQACAVPTRARATRPLARLSALITLPWRRLEARVERFILMVDRLERLDRLHAHQGGSTLQGRV